MPSCSRIFAGRTIWPFAEIVVVIRRKMPSCLWLVKPSGGSFLCTDLYCTRYMIGTRGKGEVRTASNHVGFRCVTTPALAEAKQKNVAPATPQ